MLPLPRVAVGTVQPDVDSRPIFCGLMETFREDGVQVQGFLSRACFARYHDTAAATGLSPRHLDSWLMSPELCRETFFRAAGDCDLAVVEGQYGPAAAGSDGRGGSLDALCRWLDLPRVVVLDARSVETCRLPERLGQVDGLLLDRVPSTEHLARLATNLEALWGAPVLGALPELPELRAQMAAVPAGARPPRELGRQWGQHLRRWSQPRRVLEMAFQRAMFWTPQRAPDAAAPLTPLVVAVAYDDAINCYFPDALDLLEARGATLIDFSPLRDERLPDDIDVVYLGCGHPERFAGQLAENHCMKLALRSHVRRGGRIYAEGGGLAYLCQQLETAEGDWQRMVGIFPAVARLHSAPLPPTPVEFTLAGGTWLGPPGARLRGYQNPNWHLEPAGRLCGCAGDPDRPYALVRSSGAIGSELHLNFAAQPHVLPTFFRPYVCQLDPVDPWTAAP